MSSPAPEARFKGVVLLVALMSSFLTPFTSSSINIALPSIGFGLGLDAVAMGWIGTAYLLAAATFLLPLGRIGDIHGRKKVLLFGIIIDTAASVLAAFSVSGPMLIVFRAMQGLGGAMIFGTAAAILTSVFPQNERGRVLGLNSAAVYIGLSLGPVVGGFLTSYIGWRSVFLANALLGLIITVAVLWKLKGEWAGAKGEKIDYTGSVIYSVAMVTLMYAFSVLPTTLGLWLIGAGVLGFVVFVSWELRQKHPVLDIGLIKSNTVFAMSSLAALINFSATFAVGFLLSLYLQYIKDFTPERAGLVLISQPIMMAFLAPVAGRLSDRIDPRILASIGMAITTVGVVMLVFLGFDTPLAYVIACLVVLGLGFGFFSPPNNNAIMSSVERRQFGVGAGMIGTMRLTGQTFSMGMALMLFSLYIGRVAITPEYYPLFLKSLRTAFIISSLMCLGGIFASIARGRTRRRERVGDQG